MTTYVRYSFCVISLVSCACGLLSADPASPAPPFGHKDFYPSPEQPIGFRADGTGNYPGATPVTEWWEGTVVEDPKRIIQVPEKGAFKGRKWADRNSKNIVWKVRVPGWSDTQPVVVGDRIIGIADPDWVYCLDANTGKTLWQDRLMPLFLGPPPSNGVPSKCLFTPEEAWKKQQVADIARALFYLGGVAVRADDATLGRIIKTVYDLRDTAARLDPAQEILNAFDDYALRLEELQASSSQGRAGSAKRLGYGYVAGVVMKQYRMMIVQVWMGDVGLSQSTAVTDGECVYVAFGQGSVACYDLAGRRRWAWREVQFQLPCLYCDHTPSLVMADGVLFVRSHFGDMMGIDPKTGNILHNTDIGDSYNHGAFSTPGVMRLRSPGGKKMTVLVTQHNKVINVKDGAIVAELPFFKTGDVGHGQPRMVWSNLVICQSSQGVPPDGGPGIIAKISLSDDGKVTCEKLHNFNGAKFGNTPAAFTSDGMLLGGTGGRRRGANPYEAVGGGTLWRLTDGIQINGAEGPGASEGGGVVIAGRYAFHCIYGRWEPDGWSQAGFGAYDLGTPGTSKRIGGRRELAADEPPLDSDMETWLPPEFKGCSRPYWFGLRNGGVVPSGNRMFAQTASHVYCIGDPSVPYDWNPESRPAALRSELSELAALEAKAGPLFGLSSMVPWVRDRAIAEIRGMPTDRKSAAAPEIAKVLEAGEWPGFDAALAILREMGPQAAGGVGSMVSAARKAIADRRADRVVALIDLVSKASPGKQAELAPAVSASLKSSDPASIAVGCDAVGALGSLADKCVADLLPLLKHADERVSVAAAGALLKTGDKSGAALPVLTERLSSTNPAVQLASLNALRTAGLAAKSAVGRIAALAASRHEEVAVAAARAAESLGAEAKPVLKDLFKGLRNRSAKSTAALVTAVLAIDPTAERNMAIALAEALNDPDPWTARSAAIALGKFGPGFKDRRAKTIAVNGMVSAVKERPGVVKRTLVEALGEFGAAAEAAVAVLLEEANSTECAAAAKAALQKIKPGAGTGMDALMDLDLGLGL